MVLDSYMRTWSIRVVDSDSAKKVILPLSHAKVRHFKDGSFDDIMLSVYFIPKDESVDAEIISISVDSILNCWKNNIVSLTIPISGIEYFLLNPKFRMLQLKNLVISDYPYCQSLDLGDDIAKIKNLIGTALVRNNFDSLESLDIRNDLVEINRSLKIKSLTVYDVGNIQFIKIILHSRYTLESLNWDCKSTYDSFQFPDLKLKEINLDMCQANFSKILMMSVLDKTKSSLLSLRIKGLESEMRKEFNSISLCLLELHYENSRISNLPIILRGTSTTLTELTLSQITSETFGTLFEVLSDVKNLHLNLKKFSGIQIPGQLISVLMNSSRKTLKELQLTSFSDALSLDLSVEFTIEKLYLKDIENIFNVRHIIFVCPHLKDLELYNIKCFSWIPKKMIKLKLTDSCYKLSCSTEGPAPASLQILEVKRLKRQESCDCNMYDFGIKNLEEFVCSEESSGYVVNILNRSHRTLKEVKLSNIEDGDFHLEKKLNLGRFQASDVEIDLVKSVLMNQASPLNMLVLEDIRVKQSNPFDPSLLNILIEFRANNPHCLVEIKKKKDKEETNKK